MNTSRTSPVDTRDQTVETIANMRRQEEQRARREASKRKERAAQAAGRDKRRIDH